ncbi:MAG TPA: nucleoside monophosphate kinase [Candidatus Paceibacterota bacterium]|nr:nucleoside monophosphate kinase [Candidatus Paceibacterota bacterium]
MSDQQNKVQTFLMMGRPGSGKGTQASMFAAKVGGQIYSSGSRLREMAKTGTYFGNRTKEVMERGDLMPIWVSQYLFEEALIKLEPADTIIFEGSCRILEEAMRFHEAAVWLGRPYVAVYIDAPEDVLRERLLKRAGLEGRADDNAAALQERFDKFNELTAKSIEYFKKEGTLVTVDGNKTVEEVHAEVLKALNLQ